MKKQTVIIEITYGSAWQKELWEKSLNTILMAWHFRMSSLHRKNKAGIEFK